VSKDNKSVILLPAVGQMVGVTLLRQATPRESSVEIAYSDRTGKLCRISVPLLDAMYLRNLLNAVESVMTLFHGNSYSENPKKHVQ
jgi:hypothetical protein